MYKYGVTANCIAPVAKSRMSGNVPFGIEMGEPEDVAPMVVFLLGDAARTSPARCTRRTAGRSRCGTSPRGARDAQGRPLDAEEIAARFDEVGQERMPMLDRLEEMAKAAASGDKPNQ